MNPKIIEGLIKQVAAIETSLANYIKDHSACHTVPVTPSQTAQNAPSATKITDSTPVSDIVVKPVFPPKIAKWATAIAHWEGSKDPTNPGNLKYSPLTASWGAAKGRPAKDGGNFAVFKSPQAGMDALCNLLVLACHNELQSYHQARTLEAFTRVYAGNPPQGYINGIAAAIGVPLDTDISTFV
jgi:hypothetical protein